MASFFIARGGEISPAKKTGRPSPLGGSSRC
jgi:hypothetical protein